MKAPLKAVAVPAQLHSHINCIIYSILAFSFASSVNLQFFVDGIQIPHLDPPAWIYAVWQNTAVQPSDQSIIINEL